MRTQFDQIRNDHSDKSGHDAFAKNDQGRERRSERRATLQRKGMFFTA